MAEGITTIISRSPIPEKVADVTERASDNKQQATAVVVQRHADEKTKIVQNMDKLDTLQAVKKKEDRDENSRKKRDKKEDKKKGSQGFNLDIKV
ncbi:MAG: hypothetical protein LBH05_06865 [Deferribacteraceae bacterium]|jgi:hypothetical protein|nr:hypothetical protein [Deferribacteraceae bacterium]